MKKKIILFLFAFFFIAFTGIAQKKSSENKLKSSTFSGLKFRNIGPAFMSGRIADIAIHPQNNSIWYVAVGSGGVWKTINSGITFNPIFDHQPSYSIGCVTIDPNNPHIIWVGTGENVSGRHVGYGDGIYKSEDGGKSWKNMGLKQSEHISRIIVHPKNSNIIWVAAQGPLWSKGGERGIFKSTDGGKSWKQTLGDNEWIGATDIVMDPRNPDRLYAASWQRHRTVATIVNGGPGSGIYKSEDGGNTWKKLTKGLPGGNLGKICLAISPQKPDIVYADIELNQRTGGFYKSTDRGASWKKQSNTVSGGTGPHYYQELYADPNTFDRVYLANNRLLVTDDGGKNFRYVKNVNKHVDNHTVVFREGEPDYLLVGTDGGIYESFDLAENWRYIQNLPVTQFYKVAVDDAEPFYNIYGGTQDNCTQGGPSRTDRSSGIISMDWEIVLFADGHQPATEPGNPDIVYANWQQGNLVRADRTTGEFVYIQPIPEEGEVSERFNWDAPILVSPHSPTRIYFASQRVWRSDNRGDKWTTISGDLTKNEERITLPVMDKQWSYDAPWDLSAMSNYNTITSLAESPIQEGLIYAGTDDGLIQVTEDGGKNWRKIPVNKLPDVPASAFVNDIKADLYDANTVYIALDNHKFGDYKPYLFKSTDRGKSWKSISSNIPDRDLVWRIVQDHVKPELFFLATEFGIYFTIDAGKEWVQLKNGIPTISFRDLAIQKRENDLVGASFGRGFFVLDDYSPLRHITKEELKKEAILFPTRKAWWYMERTPLGRGGGTFGASFYRAPNPPFGAVFTYYLGKSYPTLKSERTKKESKLIKAGKDVPFPGWDALDKELTEEPVKVWLTIKDKEGKIINKISCPTGKGMHRVSWNLRHKPVNKIAADDESSSGRRRFSGGYMVEPGTYYASLSKIEDGNETKLTNDIEVVVEQMRKGVLKGSTPSQTVAFWEKLAKLNAERSLMNKKLSKVKRKLDNMRKALKLADKENPELIKKLFEIKEELNTLDIRLNGYSSKRKIGEKNAPSIRSRISNASSGTGSSTYGPTPTHIRSLEIANKELSVVNEIIDRISKKLKNLEKQLIGSGAPWSL